MNDLWVNLLAPLTIVKLGWCIMALITLVECIRVWRPLYKVSVIAQAESNDAGLLSWIRVPVKIAVGLATIATLNLLAGMVSLTFPPPPEPTTLRDSWTQLMALVIPITFMLSAGVKIWLAATLRSSYKIVISTSSGLPVKAARLVESL